MWDFGVALGAAALLVTAGPPPPDLPDPRDLTDTGPCVLPVSGSMGSCPDRDGRPPVSCVPPVGTLPGPLTLEPDCPERDPDPEGRTVPISP